jgi:hypothetical protein
MSAQRTLRLAVSAFSQRAYVGRVNKAGDCFLDGKQDVTSDFFKAVIDYFGGHEVIINEYSKNAEVVERQWRVRCTVVETGKPAEGSKDEFSKLPERSS